MLSFVLGMSVFIFECFLSSGVAFIEWIIFFGS